MRVRLSSPRSQGQATLEALLIIAFGFLLVLSIHHLGQLRSRTLDLLGESHFQSFTPSLVNAAKTPSVASTVMTPAVISIASSINEPLQYRYAKMRLGTSTYSATLLEVENQLGFDSAMLLRASAQSAPMKQSILPTLGLNRQSSLIRHSFLLPGSGQSGSVQDAQMKIAGSAMLWQKSFSQTRELVNHSAPTLKSIDQAWGRTALTSSWLMPWANELLVPRAFGQASRSQPEKAVEQTQRLINHWTVY